MTIYTYDKWVDTFDPIYSDEDNGVMQFETYGSEYDIVGNTNEHKVWTEVDGDSGTYIISGWHFVNRIHYYITKKPWKDDVEVPTWLYRSCDCMDDEKYEDMGYNPDCPDCEDGSIDVDCDTVESLRQVYGPEAEIIG